MKFEDQVSSRAPSQRLKELGVKQESIFYYTPKELMVAFHESERMQDWISAFTVAELGGVLPIHCYSERNSDGSWNSYLGMNNNAQVISQYANTEADARAKMLIYLIENGLVKP